MTPTSVAEPVLLPLPEAAALLGISTSALRRRLHAGSATGEKRPTASGFAWWVAVDGAAPRPTPTDTPRPTPTPDAPTPERPQEAPGATTTAVLARRAEEMAVYSERLLAPVLARLEAQAERIGRLEAELDAARGKIAELEAPPAEKGGAAAAPPFSQDTPEMPSAPPAEGGQAGRPWWRRLFG